MGFSNFATREMTEGEREKSNEASFWAVQSILNGVQIPEISKMKVKLSNLVQQGVLTPEMAETFLQEASAFNSMDPTARNAMLETVETEGMDPQAKNALYQLQQATGEQERGSREAILQDAQARGVSGSGIELASQMANQQGSATRLANQGFQAAADANARHMQAVQNLYGMDAQKAAAQDAINQFNAANRQSVENQNVGWRNSAEAQNLAEKQRIADSNVETKNQQELYNKGLYQQNFANQMAKGQALSNAHLGVGQSQNQIGQTTAANQGKWSDENLKKNIDEIDPSEFLDSLNAYSFEYKDGEGLPEGPHVGVMAQEVEEIAPQAVEDTPDGKMVDFSKMGPSMLAALSALSKKVHELEESEDA